MDQFRKRFSGLERQFLAAEKSLQEGMQKLDLLNQKLSDPNLYLNQKETYETVEAHQRTREQVRQLTQLWELLALEMEEMGEMRVEPGRQD